MLAIGNGRAPTMDSATTEVTTQAFMKLIRGQSKISLTPDELQEIGDFSPLEKIGCKKKMYPVIVSLCCFKCPLPRVDCHL